MLSFFSVLMGSLVACGGGGDSGANEVLATAAAVSPAPALAAQAVATDSASANSAAADLGDPANSGQDNTALPRYSQALEADVNMAVEVAAAAPVGARAAQAVEAATLASESPVGQSAGLRTTLASSVVTTRTSVTGSGRTAVPYSRIVYVDGAHPSASDTQAGTAARPYKHIAAAVRDMRPGDDIVVAAGVYREAILVPTFYAGSAATRLRAATPRTVTVKGSSETASWTAVSPGVYATAWPGEEPEQVFRAGTALRQIGGTVFNGYPLNPASELAGLHAGEGGIWPARTAGGLGELVANSFTYDAASKQLYVKLASALAPLEKLEVSALRHVLQAENASNFTVDGLDFAHANTTFTYRQGAVKVQGPGNTLQNVVVHDMDGICIQLIGDDSALLDSTVERCGQMGVNAQGKRVTIANNQINYNNARGFNKWWEAGGMKLIGSAGFHNGTVRNNVVAYNNGDGIWFDWKNTANLIESNTTAYNTGFGIHYEASQSATIRGNRSYGNAMRGIYLIESANSTVTGNAVFGNAMEGIAVVDGDRSAADASLKPLNNRVTGNTLAWNDYNRNWIQLVLPGADYGAVSDHNVFIAQTIAPRMALGFMSSSNAPFERLSTWGSVARFDLASASQTIAPPDTLQAALAARQLISSSLLPTSLLSPGW